jgi:hypothetical protein
MTRAADMAGDPLRNGEPYGELGVVLQQDPDWRDQTGAPADPQAGNIPGGKRDVFGADDFSNAAATIAAFGVDSGQWVVSSSRYTATAPIGNGDAVSVLYLDMPLPSYYEVEAHVSAPKPVAGVRATAYVIFDYQSATEFKYAGIDISENQAEVGQWSASGNWSVQVPVQVKPDIIYDLLVAVDHTVVTLYVNGVQAITHTLEDPTHDPIQDPLNDGLIGLGAWDAVANFYDIKIQAPPRPITFDVTEGFDTPSALDGDLNNDGLVDAADLERWKLSFALKSVANGADPAADLNGNGLIDREDFTLLRQYSQTGTAGAPDLFTSQTGVWVVENGLYQARDFLGGRPLVATTPLDVSPASKVFYEAQVKTDGTGGLVFDYYNDDDFKFAALDAAQQRVVIGHYREGTWTVQSSVPFAVDPAASYKLGVALDGSLVTVSVDDAKVLTFLYFSLLNDGRLGLLSASGQSQFDAVSLEGDDPTKAAGGAALLAAAPPQQIVGISSSLRTSDLDAIVAAATARWVDALGQSAADRLAGVQVTIADLPGLTLGFSSGDTVRIDATAAGYGWFVDTTPADDSEYLGTGTQETARPRTDAAAHMDLLSVVIHEFGHELGFGHEELGDSLAVGTRVLPLSLEPIGSETQVEQSIGQASSRHGAPKHGAWKGPVARDALLAWLLSRDHHGREHGARRWRGAEPE